VSPRRGLLVVEVKGWSLSQIERVASGEFYIKRDGYVHPFNPLEQASRVMYDVKNAVERHHGEAPICNRVVALHRTRRRRTGARGASATVSLVSTTCCRTNSRIGIGSASRSTCSCRSR